MKIDEEKQRAQGHETESGEQAKRAAIAIPRAS
jgi:hypothetical protein